MACVSSPSTRVRGNALVGDTMIANCVCIRFGQAVVVLCGSRKASDRAEGLLGITDVICLHILSS
jgi:hypothetical protein